MEVYEFEKSLSTRCEEISDILQWKEGPIYASEIITQWSYYVELEIEPTGWQALWKIPRVICEESKIRYPTVVFGTVVQVLFKELKAIFKITGVENDEVQLPENQEVYLEDLWVTKQQEITTLNIDRTANCIDQLRFFYKNIWMPWDNDNDDDLDWVKKHLETRIKFYDDVRQVRMKRSVARHIKMLLLEARYIKTKYDYLQVDLEDDEIDVNVSKEQITDLMKLHLRMAMIKSEIELLENPDMRRVYEDMQEDEKRFSLNDDCCNLMANRDNIDHSSNGIVYIISLLSTITEKINLLKRIKESVDDENKPVLMMHSLQQALNNFKSNDQIMLSSGEHCIKFVEDLNNGIIDGLNYNHNPSCPKAIIKSKDDDFLLLMINGNFIMKNLILDCRNVRNGILIKNGNITIENCEIIGDNFSSTKKGLIITGGETKLTLKNCTIRNFGIGLSVNRKANVTLIQSKLIKCKIGIELEDQTYIRFENPTSIITDSEDYGIWFETKMLSNKIDKQKIVLFDQKELNHMDFCDDLPWTGNCSFERNNKGNIIIWNRNNLTYLNSFLNNELSDSFENVVNLSYPSDSEDISDDTYSTASEI